MVFRYWIRPEQDRTFSVCRALADRGLELGDDGFLAGDFTTLAAAKAYIDREQEFDASPFGQEFNEALAAERWD